MSIRRVSFQTSASLNEIKQALSGLGYVGYVSIKNVDEKMPRIDPERRKLTDWQQVGLLWGLVAVLVIIFILFVDWGTRP